MLKHRTKYKIKNIYPKADQTRVVCKVQSTEVEVTFDLNDIVKNNKLIHFNSDDILKLSRLFDGRPSKVREDIPPQKYLSLISQAFTVFLIISNIAATKLTNVWGISFSGGMITFPILYILNDTLTEVYGFKASRKIIWTALFYNAVAAFILYLVILLPHLDSWSNHEAYEKVFSLSPKILFASLVSYLVGELCNAALIANLKIKLQGKWFALRAVISTLCGAFLDTSIFFCILFWKIMPYYQMFQMILILTMIKVMYEVALLPITVRIVAFLKEKENIDIFESPKLSNVISFLR